MTGLGIALIAVIVLVSLALINLDLSSRAVGPEWWWKYATPVFWYGSFVALIAGVTWWTIETFFG